MRIVNNIHLLRIDFIVEIAPGRFIPRFVNVIIILNKKITLIDTGLKGHEHKIFEYIRSQERDIEDIGLVILSHAHPDHIGGAARIKELTNCSIVCHALERSWIENIDLQYRERPVPSFYSFVERSVKVDATIEHGQLLSLEDGQSLYFTKSSGHSRGMLNIFFKRDRILFTADSVPVKDDLPIYENYFDLMRSLEEISLISEYDIMITSWTPPLVGKKTVDEFIVDGKSYLRHIDSIVKRVYSTSEANGLLCCEEVVAQLGFPKFVANLLIDRAFKSHFIES